MKGGLMVITLGISLGWARLWLCMILYAYVWLWRLIVGYWYYLFSYYLIAWCEGNVYYGISQCEALIMEWFIKLTVTWVCPEKGEWGGINGAFL